MICESLLIIPVLFSGSFGDIVVARKEDDERRYVMAANVKNYGYVLSATGSKNIEKVKPVSKQFLDDCKKVANQYPKRERREDRA